MTIRVAHDFICPWCWVALLQARKLQREFGVTFDWVGYELFPEALEWPAPPATPPTPPPANRPPTLTRFEFLLAADGISMPTAERPKRMRSHNALEAVEFSKAQGKQDEFIEILYRAYWERGENINDIDVILRLAEETLSDLADLRSAIETRRFNDRIVGFDDDAYAAGVYNVPTFFINGKSLAEQPYSVLRDAVQGLIEDPVGIYSVFNFPAAPESRPYVYINMVSTIDGKIITGERNEHVSDLGSKLDHDLMGRTIEASDAVLIGASTLRASGSRWNPKVAKRIVVTQSGNVDLTSKYLSGDGLGIIATSESAQFSIDSPISVIRSGNTALDWTNLLQVLRTDFGIEKLLCLGGSEINAELLRRDLVDELFLTVAAKVKLGRDVPTYAGGEPLTRDSVMQFELVESHSVGDEVFLRYRKRRMVN